MTNNTHDNQFLDDDDYLNAILGDPGLALRVNQLAQIKAGKIISHKIDTQLLSTFVLHAQKSTDIQRSKHWPDSILSLFKTGSFEKSEPAETALLKPAAS